MSGERSAPVASIGNGSSGTTGIIVGDSNWSPETGPSSGVLPGAGGNLVDAGDSPAAAAGLGDGNNAGFGERALDATGPAFSAGRGDDGPAMLSFYVDSILCCAS